MDHVVEGEADDAAERLCVERDDGGCDPGLPKWVSAVAPTEAEGEYRQLTGSE